MYNILFIGRTSVSVMPCFYPASESNKGQDGYDIGFNSNTHNQTCCKDQLPPSNINLLEHIVCVKFFCLALVCILHMLCGCKLLNAVNDHPTTSHIKATDNLKDYLGLHHKYTDVLMTCH
jgi:hypothetical protein